MKKIACTIFALVAFTVAQVYCQEEVENQDDATPIEQSADKEVTQELPTPNENFERPSLEESKDQVGGNTYARSAFEVIYAVNSKLVNKTNAETYTVKWGESLADVSKYKYGNEAYFPLIAIASNCAINDPDAPLPRMQLTIPNLDANIYDAKVKADYREFFKEISELYEQKGVIYRRQADGLKAIVEELNKPVEKKKATGKKTAAVAEEISVPETKEKQEPDKFALEDTDGNSYAGNAFRAIYAAYSDVVDMSGAKSYTVKWGDTLNIISRTSYGVGKEYYFPLIFLASDEVIYAPDNVLPRMKLTVPDFEKNINNVTIRAKLKECFTELYELYDQKAIAYAEKGEMLKDVVDSLGPKGQ